MVVEGQDVLAVVEALDIVARWRGVRTPFVIAGYLKLIVLGWKFKKSRSTCIHGSKCEDRQGCRQELLALERCL